MKSIYNLKDTGHFVEDSSFACYKLIFDLFIDTYQILNIKKINAPAYIQEIIEYIDSKTPNPISIEELVHIAHLSQSSLINIFKKYTGETPYSYQLRTRLKLVRMYLSNTNKTLDEIAEICHFCDSFALSKSFKKMYGISPKEYRKFDFEK